MTICDFDDFSMDNNRLDLLDQLHRTNNGFKCTLFTIPAKTPVAWLFDVAVTHPWLEFAVHGWDHNSNFECAMWTMNYTQVVLTQVEASGLYTKIFKAPGWQASKGVRQACLERSYIYADNPNYKDQRLEGLKVYDHTEHPGAWHGHIQDVCDNGLQETFWKLTELVKKETEFKFISELFK